MSALEDLEKLLTRFVEVHIWTGNGKRFCIELFDGRASAWHCEGWGDTIKQAIESLLDEVARIDEEG